jgi:hypothetical protein
LFPGSPIDRDLKRLEKWARKKNKPFTRDLVINSLNKHPPKKPGQQDGYVYHGKFYPTQQAIELAKQNPHDNEKGEFRRAIKKADGSIHIVQQ